MKFYEYLQEIPDHRGLQWREYSLSSIIGLVILSTLCGYDGLAAACRLGKRLNASQRIKLGFRRGKTPSHPVFTEALRNVDIDALEKKFANLVKSGKTAQKGLQLCLDGKTLRGSKDESEAVHLVSAFCQQLNCVYGQVVSNKGGGEIRAALDLLDKIDIEGCVITGDAMFAQKELCTAIVAKKGDYFFKGEGQSGAA